VKVISAYFYMLHPTLFTTSTLINLLDSWWQQDLAEFCARASKQGKSCKALLCINSQ
jgi:hypothetical protein